MSSSTTDGTPYSGRHVSITSLDPSAVVLSDCAFKAVVTLIWPFSASNRSAALLLADQDFRQRRSGGQIRVQFRGPVAKAVSASGISIGDVVRLHLDGGIWIETNTTTRTPGRSVSADLLFQQTITLDIVRNGDHFTSVRVDQTGEESEVVDDDPEPGPATPKLAEPLSSLLPDAWSSPAFLQSRTASRRLSQLDPFILEEDFPEPRARKRLRFGRGSGEWRFAGDHEGNDQTSEKRDHTDTQESDSGRMLVAEGWSQSMQLATSEPANRTPEQSLQAPATSSDEVLDSQTAAINTGDSSSELETDTSPQAEPRPTVTSNELSSSVVASRKASPVPADEAMSGSLSNQPSQETRAETTINSTLFPDPLYIAEPGSANDSSISTVADVTALGTIHPVLNGHGPELAIPQDHVELEQANVRSGDNQESEDDDRHRQFSDGLDGATNSRPVQVDNRDITITFPVSSTAIKPPSTAPQSSKAADTEAPSALIMCDPISEQASHAVDANTKPILDSIEYPMTVQIQTDLKPIVSGNVARLEGPNDQDSHIERDSFHTSNGHVADTNHVNTAATEHPADILHMNGPDLPLSDTENIPFASKFKSTDVAATNDGVLQSSLPDYEITSAVGPARMPEPSSPPQQQLRTSTRSQPEIFEVASEQHGVSATAKRVEPFIVKTPDAPLEQRISAPVNHPSVVGLNGRVELSETAEESRESIYDLSSRLTAGTRMVEAQTAEATMAEEKTVEAYTVEVHTAAAQTTESHTDEVQTAGQEQYEARNQDYLQTKESTRSRISDVPAILSPWFAPKWQQSEQVHTTELEVSSLQQQSPASNAGQKALESAHTEIPLSTTSASEHQDLVVHSERQSVETALAETTTLLTETTALDSAWNGLRTPLSYFTPLVTLRQHLNNSGTSSTGAGIDILAVVVSATSKPKRAKGGPKDHFTTMHVTDPSVSSKGVQVQIFRPWKKSLPLAEVGDVILLRSFLPQSRARECFLLSTESSAWAVWRFSAQPTTTNGTSQANVQVNFAKECKGPPVETGPEEENHVRLLRRSWENMKEWHSSQVG